MKSLNILKFEKSASKSVTTDKRQTLASIAQLVIANLDRLFSIFCGFTGLMFFYFFETHFLSTPLALGLLSFSILNQKRGNLLTWLVFSTALSFWTLGFTAGIFACLVFMFYQSAATSSLSRV